MELLLTILIVEWLLQVLYHTERLLDGVYYRNKWDYLRWFIPILPIISDTIKHIKEL